MKNGVLGIVAITLTALGLLIAVAMLLAAPVHATELEFSGQVRVRLEGADRSFTGEPSRSQVLQRARLGLKVIVSEDTQAFLQIQDSRRWGFEATTLSNTQNADFHQAWGQWKKSYSKANLRIRGGRQELSYGTQRIIGPVGWHNVGRSFDALHTRVSKGGWTGDLVVSRLRDERFNVISDFNDDLYFTYHQYKFNDKDMKLEGYLLYRNDRSDRYETTPGLHYSGKASRFNWDAEVAGMFGKRDYRDLSSYLASGQVHFVVIPERKVSIGGGVDYLSGDDPDTPEDELFSVARIFHTGHKFYGFMDVAPLLAGRAGLIDPYVVVKMGKTGRFSGIAAGHFFMVDQPGNSEVGAPLVRQTSSNLGTEVDVKLYLQVATKSQISIGGSVFVPGDFLKNQGRDKNATWGYAQAIVNF